MEKEYKKKNWHLFEDIKNSVTFDVDDDLPELYKKTASPLDAR